MRVKQTQLEIQPQNTQARILIVTLLNSVVEQPYTLAEHARQPSAIDKSADSIDRTAASKPKKLEVAVPEHAGASTETKLCEEIVWREASIRNNDNRHKTPPVELKLSKA